MGNSYKETEQDLIVGSKQDGQAFNTSLSVWPAYILSEVEFKCIIFTGMSPQSQVLSQLLHTFLSCEYMSGRLFSEIMLGAVVLEQLSPLVLLFLHHFEGFSCF